MSDSTRRITYKKISPSLTVHDDYKSRYRIRDDHRMAFSRFRLSPHWLAVEVVRWNRRERGHLPLEERLCPSGQVKTELHVINVCPFSQHVRDAYGFTCFYDLFSGNFDNATLCSLISTILNLYEQN